MLVNIKRLTDRAILPRRARPGDAGLDLHAIDSLALEHEQRLRIRTGLAIEIPPGFFGLILDRSGWASAGLVVLGGVIDSGYRGEIEVIMHNLSYVPKYIEPGDRIAQLLILPVPAVEVSEVGGLSESARGRDGFGSTGMGYHKD